MNTNQSHKEAKIFLDKYLKSLTLDFKQIEPQLNNINNENLLLKGFSEDSCVLFFEAGNYEASYITKENNICINKDRFQTIHRLNIDSHHAFYRNWVVPFYRTTKDKAQKQREEQLLFDYLDAHINEFNTQPHFNVGSIRTTPYEFIDIIYHEGQHLCQKNYINRLFSGLESPPNEPNKIILLFASIYDFLLNEITANNSEAPFKIEPISTPSEINAKYTAMTELNIIRKAYYKHNNVFCLHFIDTNIIPQKFDPIKASTKMFEQYTSLYDLYINSEFSNPMLSHINNFLTTHKDLIIENFKMQYETMMHIIDISIERLDAVNKSDTIY